MSQDLSIQLHRTSVVDPEKLVYSRHFGNVVRFPFLFFFHHEKIYRIVLRFCQFKGLHNLKTSLSESRIATFGDVTIPAFKLSGLLGRRVISSVCIEILTTMETANVTDLSQDDRPEPFAYAIH